MLENHFLIADDVDTNKIARIRTVAEQDPSAVIHVARTIPEAESMIATFGTRIRKAAIDFDFLGERGTGADIIRTLRQTNRNTRIALVTARDGDGFQEAQFHAMSAGANAAFSSQEIFESDLGIALAV